MRVEDLFKRLKREYIKIKLLQSCLDTLIVILVLNLAAFTLNYSYDIRILGVIGLIIFLSTFYYRAQGYSVEIYENENTQLHEVLRTAKDNLDRRDDVTQALFEDVMHRARKVSSESIIPSERIIQKLFVVGGLAILTAVSGLIAPSVNFDFDNTYNRLSDLAPGGDDEEEYMRNASEVLGESGNIDTTGSNINITVDGEGESLEDGFRRGFEDQDLRFEASEDELDEDLELAKRYSLAIRGIE